MNSLPGKSLGRTVSIVIPTHRNPPTLVRSREEFHQLPLPVEVIIVAHECLLGKIREPYPNEKVIYCRENGRGNFLFRGIEAASGEIILFLHDDTLLPFGWYGAISRVLSNEKVAGGAFSLRFNSDRWQLNFLVKLSDLLYRLTGELWGDRGIFIRRELLRENPEILRVPIMEDVRLSRFMHKNGATTLLKETVVTDAEAFLRRGIWRHALLILLCRLLYTLRFDPKLIFALYYK